MAHLWHNVRGVVYAKAFQWYVVTERVLCLRSPGMLGCKDCSKGCIPCA